MLYFLAFFVLIFLLVEAKKIRQEKRLRELFLSCFLLIISVIYGIQLYLDIQLLPNPNRILFIIKPLGDAFMKAMGMS